MLNAGVTPHMAPLPEQTWDTFSRNWDTDTRQAFTWTREALRAPLAPGSVVVLMSSGTAVRYIRTYAAAESDRAGLKIRFVALLPQLTPATGLGAAGVAGYAAREGISPGAYAERFEPILTPGGPGRAGAGGRSGQRPGVPGQRGRIPCHLSHLTR